MDVRASPARAEPKVPSLRVFRKLVSEKLNASLLELLIYFPILIGKLKMKRKVKKKKRE